MQAQNNSKIIEIDADTKYIVKCPRCNKIFQAKDLSLHVGGSVRENEQLVFIEISSFWAFNCAKCPNGHLVAIYQDVQPIHLLENVIKI